MYKDNLKRILKEKRITQKEFGDMVGYSQNMICYYLSGRSEPSISFLLKSAKALNVSLDEICLDKKENEDTTPNKVTYTTQDTQLNEIINYYNKLTHTGRLQLYYAAQSYATNPIMQNKIEDNIN